MTISISSISPKIPKMPNLPTGLAILVTGTYIYCMTKYDNYKANKFLKRKPSEIYYEQIMNKNKHLYFDSMMKYWKYGILGN